MSRPVNPSWTVNGWASNANYPAGSDPWSNQPTKVSPPSPAGGFVPNQGAAAEYFNYLLNDIFNLHLSARIAFGNVLNYIGQIPALSFRSSVTMLAGTSLIKFDAGKLNWLGGGSAGVSGGTMIRTKDLRAWPTSNEISSPITVFDGAFDVDPSGNIVQPGTGATDGAKVNEYAAGTATWTTRTGLFSPAFIAPDVVYEPVSGLWCVAGKQNGAFALGVYTSSNRTSWTSRTAPTVANDGIAGPYCRLGVDGSGGMVMQAFKGSWPGSVTSDTVSFSKSTNGGVSWGAVNAHNITWSNTAGSSVVPRPVWTGSKWVAVAANTHASVMKTNVYNSSDGVTFAVAAELTNCAISNIVALGELVVGFCKDLNGDTGRIVFSIDSGETWNYTDECVPGLTSSLAGICAAGSRLVIVDAAGGKLYFGDGTGLGVKEVSQP
jgi:hypothetical protein